MFSNISDPPRGLYHHSSIFFLERMQLYVNIKQGKQYIFAINYITRQGNSVGTKPSYCKPHLFAKLPSFPTPIFTLI